MTEREGWKRSGYINGRRPESRSLPVDEEVGKEIETTIEMMVEDLISEGWDPGDARAEARRRFGDPDQIGRESRRIVSAGDRRRHRVNFFDTLKQDTVYALRTLRASPGFTTVAVLILAIGIGANVAIFSMLKGLSLRPLPFPDPDRVVAIWETETGGRGYQPFTGPDYFEMRDNNSSFEEFGIYGFRWFNTLLDDQPQRIRAVVTTASMLRALDLPPLHGRLFTDDDEFPDRNKVAILGHEYWQEAYGGDPELIGSWITLNRASYQVVGILGPEFEVPSPWGRSEPVKLFIPIEVSRTERRGWHTWAALGRLKPGVSPMQAEADLRVIAARLQEEYPDTNGQTDVWIDPLMRRALGSITGNLIALLIVVGFVLFVAAANVASMLLARGVSRQTEIAIRSSFGAGARRIMRQLLTESMILSIMGGIVGIIFAFWSLGALKGLFPPTVPRVEGIQIDGWVLFFAFAIMTLTGLLFGLVPALFAARTNLVAALTGSGGGRSGGGRRRNRFLSGLVIGQLAVALLLVNLSVLILISFVNITRLQQGYDTEEVLVASLVLDGPAYETSSGRMAFWNELLPRLESVPGVEAVGVTTKLPANGGTNGSLLIEGEAYDNQERRPLVEVSYVTPGYFAAMGIEIRQGRGFEDTDVATGIAIADNTGDRAEFPSYDTDQGVEFPAIVNETFVRRYWPEEEIALGRRFRANSAEPQWSSTIVGVVEDVRQWGLTYPALRERYHPLSLSSNTSLALVLRAERDPAGFAAIVRETVKDIDPLLPVDNFRTMADVVHGQQMGVRIMALLIGLFALIAVALAAAGTYGVMSFRMSQRTHEIGVRIALGADRSAVVRHFILRGLKLTGIGGIVGVGLILAATAALSSTLFGIQAVQVLYVILGIVALGIVVFLATALPAIRATRVDPVDALRVE